MKNPRALPLIIISLMIFFLLPIQFSCEVIDWIRGLETFHVDYEGCSQRPVIIAEDDPDYINENFTLSGSDNEDLYPYLGDVEGWDIIVAYLQISNFSGDPDITFTGTVMIGSYTETFTDIKPSEWEDGRFLYLTLDNETLTELNQDLNEDNEIDVSISGQESQRPISFILHFCLEAVVEVKTRR